MDWFNGKKTYIAAACIAVVTGLAQAGIITAQQEQAALGILAAFGLYALRQGVSKAAPVVLAILGLGLATAPAYAQDADPDTPFLGCGGGTCSLYFVEASWPPALGVNGLEFVRGRFGVGMSGVHTDGDVTYLGGLCLIPRVGPTLGPLCGGIGG